MPEQTTLLFEALELVRYYRTRMHRAWEDEAEGYSKYHVAYGIHYDAMQAASDLLAKARELHLLEPEVREWH